MMTTRVVSVKRSTSIKEIMKIFLEHPFHFLPVVDEEGNLLGVITEKDVLTPFIPEYFDLFEDLDFVSDFGKLEEPPIEILENLLVAEDVMRKNPVVIQKEASLFKAIVLMTKKGVAHLPVVEGKKLLGVISRTDILKAIFEESP